MRPQPASYMSRVLLGTSVHARSFSAARRRWRLLRTSAFDAYRPELHYMRGPGPKCREWDGGRPPVA
jgi:hypothetical protein